jgi:hypothetical protein
MAYKRSSDQRLVSAERKPDASAPTMGATETSTMRDHLRGES